MPRGVTLFDEQLIQGRVDSDALTYIDKVERTDGASLEPGIKVAINDFVVNCKAFGLWEKLSVILIMAGARTLNGAITALKGPLDRLANGGFVQSDYDRQKGVIGDGSSFFFISNYSGTSEPLNDYHICVSLSNPIDTVGPSPIWGFGGSVYDRAQTHDKAVYSRTTSAVFVSSFAAGFSCLSRDNSSNFNWRNNKTTNNYSSTSVAANSDEFRLFRSSSQYTTNTMKYFSGGKSIAELPLYDELVSTLLADIARAIN
jgi:hypothetical protein